MINYNILHQSTLYYENLGFKRIESPWTVTPEISAITKPPEKIDFELKHNGKVLVASGEQSFLYLYVKDFIPFGKYQTITPCYRYENFDAYHTKYFMKNELIITDDVTTGQLDWVINVAKDFFSKYLTGLKVIKTAIGYDIEWNNIELGSYGIRSCDFLKWVYATGVAEPRLSNIIRKANGIS